MYTANSKARTAVIALVLLLAPTGAAAGREPEPVTSCGNIGKFLYLAADIDCTGTPLGGVGLYNGGVLDLNGFTISGSATNGVYCMGRCRVFGGGTIEGSAQNGIEALRGLRISNVTIRRNSRRGINGWRNVRVEDSTIIENLDDGVATGRTIKVYRSTISNNGCPAWNGPCDHNPPPFSDGIQAARTGRGKAIVIDSTVSDNAFGGITAVRLKARNVVALGNMIHPECNATVVECGDIESTKKPKVDNVTCDRSTDFHILPTIPWGICALD